MALLPTGTVTFLFTDIENSTRLWEEHPDAMRRALARHDTLLRTAIEGRRGVVFKTVGDAFCAAFPAAPAAVAAALDAQIALHAEPWPNYAREDDGRIQEEFKPGSASSFFLRVRMALHAGTCELRNDDYFGPPLNRLARLLAVGHGGQILLSRTVYALARDSLPAAAELRELGSHRLKDLQRPESIFQLLHPLLPPEFPSLRSLDNPALPNNLPQQTTSFIGRQRAIAEVQTLLSKTRLLTLTGSGGCGKTRLALQVAAERLDAHPDGVLFVELAPLTDPALLPQAVANMLGVKEEAGTPLAQTITNSLKPKRLLLLLDNCEHLLDACARLADTLLRNCPYLQLLATSREGLNIAGELTYRVPSLSLPRTPRQATVESLAQCEAARLFLDRAQFHQPAFVVTGQNAPALAQLCVHLDGIPLALELAAARVRSLSVEEINGKLDNRFRLLTGGSRTALPRQQTLRAAIDWSYELLTERERTVLNRLSVFAGGWTLEAAEVVCTDEGNLQRSEPIEDWELLDLLTSLTDKNLTLAEPQDGQTRYRLLETIQQYAGERLAERGEAEAVRRKHRDYFLALAQEGGPQVRGRNAVQWMARLEAEHDNLRAAIAWSLNAAEGAEGALRLTASLGGFWYQRGYVDEGRTWLARALALPVPDLSMPERLDALDRAGWLAHCLSDTTEASRLYEEMAARARERGNTRPLAAALNGLGLAAQWHRHDYAAARAYLQESLALNRTLPDGGRSSANLLNLGRTALWAGDYAAAQTYATEALQLYRRQGELEAEAVALACLAEVSHAQGDHAQAQPLYAQAERINRDQGFRQRLLEMLCAQGELCLDRGELPRARQLFAEALTLAQEANDVETGRWARAGLGFALAAREKQQEAATHLAQALSLCQKAGDLWKLAFALEGAAALAAATGEPKRAARLLGAAGQVRERHPMAFHPNLRQRHRGIAQPVDTTLGAEAFDAAFAEGQTLTPEQAVALALETSA
jgi:predicted ATPase/class 3 adenylate cyclase